MDLQYCDQCGSVLQNRMGPSKPGETVVCEVCKTGRIPEPAKTEEHPGSSPGVKITLRENAAATTAVVEDELKLFSDQTIARRKTQTEAEAIKEEKPRIKIVEGGPGSE